MRLCFGGLCIKINSPYNLDYMDAEAHYVGYSFFKVIKGTQNKK
jgi:hypothetical protein